MRSLQIAVIGAGPAGLYFSILIKKLLPDVKITIVEQNSRDVTFGFGVAYSGDALNFLKNYDPMIYATILDHSIRWDSVTVMLNNESTAIEVAPFLSFPRIKLLKLLDAQLAGIGILVNYNTRISDINFLDSFDLIVAADGINSIVRSIYAKSFGTSIAYQTNRFSWYGTDRFFNNLTQCFISTKNGFYNAHCYPYLTNRSTFIVETDAATWFNNHLGNLNEEESKRYCEFIFSDILNGAKLISNQSIWRQFPNIKNKRWFFDKYVLIGDAAHTAHFSIGSGTRLAMEDAIALVEKLAEYKADISSALEAYERSRRPIVEDIIAASRRSANWYENFAKFMKFSTNKFVESYLNRCIVDKF